MVGCWSTRPPTPGQAIQRSTRSKDDYEEIRLELIEGFDVIYFDEDTWK